jgi:hypothetical protein
LSIALEEVAVDKIVPIELPDEPEESEVDDGEKFLVDGAPPAADADDEGA